MSSSYKLEYPFIARSKSDLKKAFKDYQRGLGDWFDETCGVRVIACFDGMLVVVHPKEIHMGQVHKRSDIFELEEAHYDDTDEYLEDFYAVEGGEIEPDEACIPEEHFEISRRCGYVYKSEDGKLSFFIRSDVNGYKSHNEECEAEVLKNYYLEVETFKNKDGSDKNLQVY